MDVGGDVTVRANSGLKIVSEFKYLGINVSLALQNFDQLNITPLISKLHDKLVVWAKLPLSVVGRINLVKMIWIPQILYILHNSPTWIPMRYFYKLNQLFRRLM